MSDDRTLLHRLDGLHQEMVMFLADGIRHHPEGRQSQSSLRTSTQEALLLAREQVAEEWDTIERVAAELTWRGAGIDGPPAAYIAARLTWARNNIPDLDSLLEPVRRIYYRWLQATRRTAPKHGEICPKCGQHMTTPTETRLWCPKHGEMLKRDYEAAIYAALLQHGQFLTIQQTRQQYGLTWRQLEDAISREKIHVYRLGQSRKRRLYTLEIEKAFHQNTTIERK